MSVAGPSIGTMTLSLSHVHVFADDPDAALAFYRDALGLEVRSEVPNEGFRWITLSTQEQPELEIVLSHPKAGRSEQDGEMLSAMLAKGELPGLLFRTSDLDALFEKVQAAGGVEVLQEPTDQFWGVRDAAFRDPSGNLVRVSQA
jgi:catechol 2,3-dioxygenase-like lactoylglutathione lyase family enzyme